MRLTGKLDINVLERTFYEIIRRHEILRTNFIIKNHEPKQYIHKQPLWKLELVDQSHLPKDEAFIKIIDQIRTDSQRIFDLEKDSLIRLVLYKIDNEDHILFLNKHHIISDGWSFSVLLNEISLLYKAFSENEKSPLPELPIQYGDYTVWQREYIKGEVLEKQENYWRKKLSGTKILELPTDKDRPAEQTFNGNTIPFSLEKEILEKLYKLSETL